MTHLSLPLNQAQISQFQTQLLNWFDHHGRHDLPWQQDKTPYRVWVSEIMLQQTQVKTVIPYYESFISHFPTLTDLAQADEDQVLALWSGLGYYSRARNLHKAAKQVVSDFGGDFPDTVDAMQTLPGIGRSTAGAILAISRNQSTPIQDGNVRRVLSRIFTLSGDLMKADNQKHLWQIATDLTPEIRVADYTQAIMDLGATLCRRSSPDCPRCPFNTSCGAFVQSTVSDYPQKKQTKKLPIKSQLFLFIYNDKNQLLLKQRTETGVWAKLWCPPQFDDLASAKQYCQNQQITISNWQPLEQLKHKFSHYQLNIQPVIVKASQANQINESNQRWESTDYWLKAALPTPIKSIINQLNTSKA